MQLAILITGLTAAAGAVALIERSILRRGLKNFGGKTEIIDGGDARGRRHPLEEGQFDTRTILELMKPARWGTSP